MSRRSNVALKTRTINGAADKLLQLRKDKLQLEQNTSLDVLKKQQQQLKDELYRALKSGKSSQSPSSLTVHKPTGNRRRSASAIDISSDLEQLQQDHNIQSTPRSNRSRAESVKPYLTSSISAPDQRLITPSVENSTSNDSIQPQGIKTSRSSTSLSWYGQIDDDDDDDEEDYDHKQNQEKNKTQRNANKLPKPSVKISLQSQFDKHQSKPRSSSACQSSINQRLQPISKSKGPPLSTELSPQVKTNGKKTNKQTKSRFAIVDTDSSSQHQHELSLPPMRKALSSSAINLISSNNC